MNTTAVRRGFQQRRRSSVVPSALALIIMGMTSVICANGQCQSDGIELSPGTNRDSGNDMQGIGYVYFYDNNNSGTWYATLTLNFYFLPSGSQTPQFVSSYTAPSPAQIVSTNPTDPGNPNRTLNVALNGNGAGNYYTTMSAVVTNSCGQQYNLPQVQSPNHPVSLPTISGFCCNNAFWNLGPSTNDPQSTWNGGVYYQSVPLTFNTNCVQGDTCNDTPQWSLTTNNSQATLTSTSGATTTIKAGSSQGTCQYDSTLSASMGGFSTAALAVAVNSPTGLLNTSSSTSAYMGGYQTNWVFEIIDACQNPDVLYPIPVEESFGAFQQENGASGWSPPAAAHWEPGAGACGFDPNCAYWTDQLDFTDGIAAYGNTLSPVPTYTVSGPPYTYNTLLYDGPHNFYSSDVANGGFQIYSGTIQYFQDHGQNVP